MERKLEALSTMSFQDFEEQVANQQRSLPLDQTIPASNQAIAERLGKLLLAAEEHRIKGTKKIPLWPLEWKDMPALGRRCTGRLLRMGRVCSQSKELEDGSSKENRNYGRFFVYAKDPVKDADGNIVMRTFTSENGKEYETEETAMVCFQWFDETMFVRSGAMAWATSKAPKLAKMLTTWGVNKVPVLWPVPVMNDLYSDGLTQDQVLARWGAKPLHVKVHDVEEEKDEDEIETDRDSFVVDDEPPPPTKRQKKRGRGRQFIDDEAAED